VKSLRQTFLLVILLLLTAVRAGAQLMPVQLKTGPLQVPELSVARTDSINRSVPAFANRRQLLLQFAAIPSAATIKWLESRGILLQDYVPDNAYTALVEGPLSQPLLQEGGVRGIWVLLPEQKIDMHLLRPQLPPWALRAGGSIQLLVRITAGMPVGDALVVLQKRGFRVAGLEWQHAGVVALQAPVERLRELAALPFVGYVQADLPRPQVLTQHVRSATRAAALQASLASGGRGLNGEGVVVGVGDDSDPQTHTDFAGRVISRMFLTYNNHGTHVSGIIAGGGHLQELYRGLAPQATLISSLTSAILENAAQYRQDHGMVLTNNSYGFVINCSYHGTYDMYAQLLDQQALALPDLLHVFAAGNSGDVNCSAAGGGFRTVLGGHQSAKNIVTVGSTSALGQLAANSSRGPVRDGRIKPELVAPGENILSTVGTASYGSNSGTSMSAPAVTGGMALLVQRYRQLLGGQNPPGGLLKALICNGASDLGNAGPDYRNGYGWMNLVRSNDMLENNRFSVQALAHGAIREQVVTVPVQTAQLKVLLYWHDLPASLVAAKTLVNDLDLEVVDPSGNILLPYRLDTSNAGLALPAFRGIDRINNLAQVVIDLPAAGNYTLRVRGTTVTNGSQDYFLVWDPVPGALQLTHPVGGSGLVPGESVNIHWEAPGNTAGSFSVQFSTNDGLSWQNLDSTLPASARSYTWTVPQVVTGQARVRVLQQGNGQNASSGRFAIISQPVVVLASSTEQCEATIRARWRPVGGATDYEVFLLRGNATRAVSSTTDTTILLRGLSVDTVYLLSVRARVQGEPGRRSLTVSRQPSFGGCNPGFNGDLRLAGFDAATVFTGRQHTPVSLSNAYRPAVLVRNLGYTALTGFQIQYRVNTGPWVTENSTATIALRTTTTYTFNTSADLSQVGSYQITVVVKRAGDSDASNDTLVARFRQLSNDTLSLPFSDGFESLSETSVRVNTQGIAGDSRYDYNQSGSAFTRLRTRVNSGMLRSGQRAITLDLDRIVPFSTPPAGTNLLTGTYNLSRFRADSNDLRLDFHFMHHGQTAADSNKVWIRGSSSSPWIEARDLFSAQGAAGSFVAVSGLELSRLLRTAGQNFSSTFQVRWGQQGSFPASDPFNARGYTFDDIRIYELRDDLELRALLNPGTNTYGLTAATAISIRVRNRSSNPLSNVPVAYRVNGGSWVNETLSSVAAGDSAVYTFAGAANLSAPGVYQIQAVVSFPGDNQRENDTLTTLVTNNPLVSAFPYLQDFESSSTHWYAGGQRSSWQWGQPASLQIRRAASGSKAWKTRLGGIYNEREWSYLYSPFFSVSSMASPHLSFSIAMDIEDCGNSICDAAWVEYSTDGSTWQVLGNAGSGTNWYNRSGSAPSWVRQDYTAWRVATIALPQGVPVFQLRFVLRADEFYSRDGIAIDDIHIYDQLALFDTATSAAVSQNVSGAGWTHFVSGGKLLASVQPNNQNLGATEVRVFIDTTVSRFANEQYLLGRSYTVKPQNRNLADSVTLRLYFTDREAELMIRATGCTTCSAPASAYDLGVSKYTNANQALEDSSVANNNGGEWTFIGIPARSIVPFDKGYYAEFRVKSFSEFWFNTGGIGQDQPLPVRLLSFTARRNAAQALLNWQVAVEEDVADYVIEVAEGEAALRSGQFRIIGAVTARGNTNTGWNYQFADARPDKSGMYYYRLRIRNRDGSQQLSTVRSVFFGEEPLWTIHPNPSDGIFQLSFRTAPGPVQLYLHDATGRLLRQWQHPAAGYSERLAIDLTHYAPGAYLLRVASGGRTESLRLYRR